MMDRQRVSSEKEERVSGCTGSRQLLTTRGGDPGAALEEPVKGNETAGRLWKTAGVRGERVAICGGVYHVWSRVGGERLGHAARQRELDGGELPEPSILEQRAAHKQLPGATG